MNGTHHVPPLSNVVIYAIVAALLIWRNSRPQRMTVTRMWLGPSIMVAMTALAIWGEQQLYRTPPLFTAAALATGVLLAIPLGLLRGKHTNVRATQTAGVMYLDASWVVMALWLGAFIVRTVLRSLFPVGVHTALLGDALLAFAISAVVVSYYAIYQKYRSLEIEAGQATR